MRYVTVLVPCGERRTEALVAEVLGAGGLQPMAGSVGPSETPAVAVDFMRCAERPGVTAVGFEVARLAVSAFAWATGLARSLGSELTICAVAVDESASGEGVAMVEEGVVAESGELATTQSRRVIGPSEMRKARRQGSIAAAVCRWTVDAEVHSTRHFGQSRRLSSARLDQLFTHLTQQGAAWHVEQVEGERRRLTIRAPQARMTMLRASEWEELDRALTAARTGSQQADPHATSTPVAAKPRSARRPRRPGR